MVDTYDSLVGGLTKLVDAWNDLDQADLTKDQLKGLLFIAATEKNLSEESWKCWLDVQNDSKYKQNPMDAFKIQTYLGAINTAMLNAQRRKTAFGPREEMSRTPARTGRQQSTLYGSYSNAVQENYQPKGSIQQQARGQDDTCVFCNKSRHKISAILSRSEKDDSKSNLWCHD